MSNFGCQEWSCERCTLVNSSNFDECAACSNRRTDYIDRRPEDMSDGSISGPDGDSELALMLANKLENYFELAELDTTDLITCLDHFECSVCLVCYYPGDGVTLKDCLHTFCRECLALTIKHNTEPQVKCPYSDEEYVCNSVLQEREIKALVSPEVYEEHLTRSVSEAEHRIQNTFHCKTVNCQNWCILEADAVQFCCPVCGNINCIKCQSIHTGLTCRQYKELRSRSADDESNQLHVQRLLNENKAMSCPGCEVIVMKDVGCDWLRCPFCKTEICWVTRGPRWGPKGSGDTSAGCRCKVNGVKCHPACGNCH